MAEDRAPRKASTIVLVRPSDNDGFEIFMTRRPVEMRFLGGFFVFPGGSVKRGDSSDAMLDRCRGLSPEDAQRQLGDELSTAHSMGHWVAAIRELYEEAGILLYVTRDGRQEVDAVVAGRIGSKREDLLSGSLSFPELLQAEDLYCDVGRPVYFYHRVTPEQYSMRFDTRFYLAVLPAGQVPLASSEEVTESAWITPGEGLRRAERGRMAIIPPTLTTLRTLAELGSWDALCDEFGLPR